MDSKVAKRWGRNHLNKTEIVNNLMHDMAYKASQNILKRWSEEAGKAFDWYLEGLEDIAVLDRTDRSAEGPVEPDEDHGSWKTSSDRRRDRW